jgi:hypothetical protein
MEARSRVGTLANYLIQKTIQIHRICLPWVPLRSSSDDKIHLVSEQAGSLRDASRTGDTSLPKFFFSLGHVRSTVVGSGLSL